MLREARNVPALIFLTFLASRNMSHGYSNFNTKNRRQISAAIIKHRQRSIPVGFDRLQKYRYIITAFTHTDQAEFLLPNSKLLLPEELQEVLRHRSKACLSVLTLFQISFSGSALFQLVWLPDRA